MVKCSLFNQIIGYQSFCGRLLMFKLFFTSKVLCFGTCRQVTCEMFIKCLEHLMEKIISPILFGTNCLFKWLNTLSLTKELFIKVSTVHCSHLLFSSFSKESCVFRHTFSTQGAHTSSVSVYIRNIKKCMGEH